MSVVILGGGVGGLSSMYYLLKYTKYKVILVESSNRLGGWIRSQKQNNLIFEQGPRTLRPQGNVGINTLNLLHDLNLSDSVRPIRLSHPAAKNRFIYVNGKLYALPRHIFSIFKANPPCTSSILGTVLRELRKPFRQLEDESIYSFVERRYSKEFADYFISPLICGICAGDAKNISVRFLLNKQFQYEQQYHSVFGGYLRQIFKKKEELIPMSKLAKRAMRKEHWSAYHFDEGMETVTKALNTAALDLGGTILKNCSASKINFKEKTVETSEENIKFDHVVSTLPAHALAPLVFERENKLARELLAIPYVSVVTVNLAYTGKHLKKEGFGFLVPPQEKLPILGIIFDSTITNVEDHTVLTVMMGGHAFKSFEDNCSEEYLLTTATKYVAEILDINERPTSYKINVLRNCIPQQVVGHYHRVMNIENYIEKFQLPLHLVGNAFRGTGINDVIWSARNMAVDVAKHNAEYCK